MPSLRDYRSRINAVQTSGMAKKIESDNIMEETWWEDINSRYAYFYDFYHDSEPLQLRDLHPEKDHLKVKIPIKFLQYSSQTYSKDVVTFHIQFMPSQNCTIDYYKEIFEQRYGAIWPVGLYVDIQDEKGKFNRWLVVDEANYNVTQFPTFEILPCDKVIQYIFDGKKYQFPGVLRSQNSYNSGIWRDNATTTTEDQYKFLLPLNRDTEKLYYNQRLIIDANVLTEPRAWQISKINRIMSPGISLFTLSQDKFNQHTDYIEKDEIGNVIGMWADYWRSSIEPIINEIPIKSSVIHSSISYSGTKPLIKVGGSYKKFTVSFTDDEIPIDPLLGSWSFSIDDEDVSSIFTIVQTESSLNGSQIKIKAPNDPEYIGKVLTIKHITDKTTASINVEIVAL